MTASFATVITSIIVAWAILAVPATILLLALCRAAARGDAMSREAGPRAAAAPKGAPGGAPGGADEATEVAIA